MPFWDRIWSESIGSPRSSAHCPLIGRLSINVNEMTDYLEGVHDQVKQAIKDSNTKYKTQFDSHKRKVTFEVGNLVWVVLTHDHFLVNKCNKLLERKVGRCEVLQKINANGYRLRLPSYLKSSHVFNAKTMWTRGRVLSNQGRLM